MFKNYLDYRNEYGVDDIIGVSRSASYFFECKPNHSFLNYSASNLRNAPNYNLIIHVATMARINSVARFTLRSPGKISRRNYSRS